MPTEDLSGNDLVQFSGFEISNMSEFTGAAAECFPGLSLNEQDRAIFEALGGNPLCWFGWSREERQAALYTAAGGTDACFGGRSPEEKQRLLYEAFYDNAESTDGLAAPSCFNGLSPELKEYNIWLAATL